MTLRVAIQMDPLDAIDIDGDSTFALGLEAQRRGHQVFHYLPRNLSYRDGCVSALANEVTLRRMAGDHFTAAASERLDLSKVDVVLMRQDPPFDMSYISATHLLELIHPETLVVNDPVHVRNAPEKLFVTFFAEFMPPTLITCDGAEIKAFREEFGDIIVKPLYGNGGAGVFHIRPEDENLSTIIEFFEQLSNEPLIVQQYLPEVRAGDKRIILVDGEPVGAINRVPAAGEARSNMHAGGRPEASRLNAREQEICAALGPALKERGMIFVGIDVIGDYLTEINVTSPTGIQELDRFDGTDTPAKIWDAIEGRL
ncbi:MAG: glutathione synthase [Sphingomonadales bacterium]|nr:glutathione synthase [Sphingomonadales bacterium]